MKTKNKSQEFGFQQFCLKMDYLGLDHHSVEFLKGKNNVILAEVPVELKKWNLEEKFFKMSLSRYPWFPHKISAN